MALIMAVYKVVLSLLKRQKAYGVTIFCLSLIVSLMLSCVLAVLQRSGELQREAFKNISMPDVMFFLVLHDPDEQIPKLRSDLSNVAAVKSFEEGRALATAAGGKDIIAGGQELQESFIIAPYKPELRDYRIKAHEKGRFTLGEDEVLFPLMYEQAYSIKSGDHISIGGREFAVAGFFEDPMLGSPAVGASRAYVNERSFDKLCNESDLQSGVFLYVNVRADSTDPDYAAQVRSVLEGVDFVGFGIIVSKLEVTQFSMMMPNLVLAMLSAFALLSLLITLFILRYAVLSSIEGSYVTFGIFKAVGFTGIQIRFAVMLQYALVCLLGSAAGVLIGIPLIPGVGDLVMVMAGLLWSGGSSALTSVFVIFAIVLLISFVSLLNTRKVMRISPVRAISFGRAPVYFAQRLNIPLRRLAVLPLHIRLAIKQMMTRRKQYALLIVIAALLTFLASFMGGTARLFDDTGEVLYLFGFPRSDVCIMYIFQDPLDIPDEAYEQLDRIVAEISEKYPVEKAYGELSGSDYMEGVSVMIFRYDTYEGIGLADPLSGRFPIYDNEVALSPVMATLLGKGIGDKVYLSNPDGDPVSFIVTGMVQNIENSGYSINMTIEGAQRQAPSWENLQPLMWNIIFESGTDVERVAAEIKSKYENDDILVFRMEENVAVLVDSISSVIDPVTGVSFVLTAVLIALITFLLAIIAIYRENADIGIFKAVGFTSVQLRLQFALRFLLVSLTGGVIGIGVSILASDAVVTFIFRFFGLAKVRMDLGTRELLLPFLLVGVISLIAAWLVSARIKRVSARVLITE